MSPSTSQSERHRHRQRTVSEPAVHRHAQTRSRTDPRTDTRNVQHILRNDTTATVPHSTMPHDKSLPTRLIQQHNLERDASHGLCHSRADVRWGEASSVTAAAPHPRLGRCIDAASSPEQCCSLCASTLACLAWTFTAPRECCFHQWQPLASTPVAASRKTVVGVVDAPCQLLLFRSEPKSIGAFQAKQPVGVGRLLASSGRLAPDAGADELSPGCPSRRDGDGQGERMAERGHSRTVRFGADRQRTQVQHRQQGQLWAV